MYLLFIDDSGSNDLLKDNRSNEGNSEHFFLGAVLVPMPHMHAVDGKIVDLLAKCQGGNHKELKFSPGKKTPLKCTTCEMDLSLSSGKNCFREQACKIVSDTELIAFGTILNKRHSQDNGYVKSKNDIYSISFQYLLRAVMDCMYDSNIKENVVVFIDDKTSIGTNLMICKAYREALEAKDIYRRFDTTIYNPYLCVVDSLYSYGTQLADIVAGSCNSYFSDKNKELLESIVHKFYGFEKGQIGGNGLVFCEKKLQ